MARRLQPLTDHTPQCLLDVQGKPLLQRILERLFSAGIDDAALVVGFQSELVRSFVKSTFPNKRIRYIFNPNYHTTNNAYGESIGIASFSPELYGTIIFHLA